MSVEVKPGQVWVPRPDHILAYQKRVVAVEDGFVKLEPHNYDKSFPRRNNKRYSVARFISCYRMLWAYA